MSRARQIDQVRTFIARTGGIHRLHVDQEGAVERVYDVMAAMSAGNDGYMNFGYWLPGTASVAEASDNLMAALVARMAPPRGRILDVACGLGATTRFLCRHWPAASIVGINLTERQVARCRELVPQCAFSTMNAASISYEDESFDRVVCVEAALHFRTRRRFLEHALRILTKGGVLAMSDLLVYPEGHDFMPVLMPAENYLPSSEAYRDLLLDVGFATAEVTDITDNGWSSFARHEVADAHASWFAGRCDFAQLQSRLSFVYAGAAMYSSNLLCVATK